MYTQHLAAPPSGAPAASIPALLALVDRSWLESRCERLADELQRLIALLDALDGNCDIEEGGDLETSLGGLSVRTRDGRIIEDAEYDNSDHEWSLGWRDKLHQGLLADGWESDLEASSVANLATCAEVAL